MIIPLHNFRFLCWVTFLFHSMGFPYASADEQEWRITATILPDGVHDEWFHELPGFEEDGGLPVAVQGNTGLHRIHVPLADLSPIVRYRGPRELVFFNGDGASGDGAANLPVAGSVLLPEDATDVLLLFVVADFRAKQFNIKVVPNSEVVFPRNTVRLMNFSRVPLRYNLSGAHGEVAAGSIEIIALPTDKRYARFGVAGWVASADRWIVLQNRYLQVRDGLRINYMVFPAIQRSGEDFLIRTIREDIELRHRNLRHHGDAALVEIGEEHSNAEN